MHFLLFPYLFSVRLTEELVAIICCLYPVHGSATDVLYEHSSAHWSSSRSSVAEVSVRSDS